MVSSGIAYCTKNDGIEPPLIVLETIVLPLDQFLALRPAVRAAIHKLTKRANRLVTNRSVVNKKVGQQCRKSGPFFVSHGFLCATTSIAYTSLE